MSDNAHPSAPPAGAEAWDEADPVVAAHLQRLRDDGAPNVAIRGFLRALHALRSGQDGMIREADIEPIATLPDAEQLAAAPEWTQAGLDALATVAVIKLNGGLGTTMGMRGAKSLVEVRDGKCFLELAAQQVLALRRLTGCRVPLVLMDSFRTRDESLACLAQFPELDVGLPLDFLQHRVPKVLATTLLPAEAPPGDTAAMQWCPPGHGDLYAALWTSGVLTALRERGIRHAFVSNIDNLGATLDLAILGWMVRSGAPMVMEVADRTFADRKGGHLARRPGSDALLLREAAQCAREDAEAFADIERHRYFNTNSIWLDLAAIEGLVADDGPGLDLPIIVNRKHVDPNDPSSPAVIQLESAMGAAIAVLPGARAVRVPRSRFAPVKSATDLLMLRSDRFRLEPSGAISATRPGALPRLDLDEEHFRTVDDLAQRFPQGVPSLASVRSLRVRGDVRFDRDARLDGDVEIVAPIGTIAHVGRDGVRFEPAPQPGDRG